MLRSLLSPSLTGRGLWLVAGVVLGLVIANVAPVKPLHAVATDRQSDLAICTAPVGDGIEGVFTLDFQTGELRGAVLNPTRKAFVLSYSANCVNDLKIEAGKAPKFVIVSGDVSISTRGLKQYGSSAIYVADLTSGNMAAYAIPFNPSMNSSNAAPSTQPLELLYAGPFRAATR